MPHPILIAAGMAIIVGTGYVIYHELNKKSDEEEAYHTYCAAIRAEKEARNKRLSALQINHTNQQASHSSSVKLQNDHQSELRHRHKQMDYPLIDLTQQVYPPIPPPQSPSASASQSHTKPHYSFSPILDIPIPNSVIFIAPEMKQSVEFDKSTRSHHHEKEEVEEKEKVEDRVPVEDQDGSNGETQERDLLDWKPQEDSTTLAHLFGLHLTSSPPSNNLDELEQTEFFESSESSHESLLASAVFTSSDRQDSQSSHHTHDNLQHALIVPHLPLTNSSSSPDHSDDWSVADEPLQSLSASPSLDENWSDLGSEAFEHI
ncbi:hypothetical protein PCANC_04225 [Puccinia coronata f. sp. avenae]|uniref:Uncharacterized protein n=1 Tax=Puccinia coronata f. sp. avenae TaxID=200324 RepID=A0A2N5VX29_9BASI|nr:hypothetical protein PCANC_04225 [Puccinia coronata f. sp. avenae]